MVSGTGFTKCIIQIKSMTAEKLKERMQPKNMMAEIREKEQQRQAEETYAEQFNDKYHEPEPDRHTIHLNLSNEEIDILLQYCEAESKRLGKMKPTLDRVERFMRIEHIKNQIVENAF
jgi:hypothetical protein